MQTKTTTTTPALKPDAQPVQAAIPARPKLGAPASAWADYHAAISAAGIRFQDKLNADFVAKAQPVQAVSSTPEPAVLRLRAALETINEAGRMSDQPRAVYCALIAEDALNAAGNREDLETRWSKGEALLAALEQCLPYVDRVRAMSGGDGDLTALTARAALNAAKGGAQ